MSASNRARAIQLKRFAGMNFFCNAQMGSRELRAHCQIEAAGERLLELAINRLGLSARAYTRILKVARTIADLDDRSGSKRSTSARRFSIDRSIARRSDRLSGGIRQCPLCSP